ncbi:MAG TPA: HAD-IA family hydrolase, partial [Gaiellales bacterium]|nr:HAD-IA family hydrolase [Gaiellales bacterium]
YDAVLLDAFGTLITVDDPFARLRRAIAETLAVDVAPAAAEEAFLAEMRYYADHCHEGRDPASLEALHADCAAIVLEHLGIDLDPHEAVRLLGYSIRYRAYSDAGPALAGLRAAQVAVAVVSNADYTLPRMLEQAGLRIEHVCSSAATGFSKPHPGIFRAALSAIGAEPGRALHVGDTPAADAAGARAAGVDVRIIDRSGDGTGDTIAALTEILELIG